MNSKEREQKGVVNGYTRAVRWEGPKGPRTGRAELPQFGDECLLLVAAMPLSGCVCDWQEAGQGLSLLALGFGVCGVQRAAAGHSAAGPPKAILVARLGSSNNDISALLLVKHLPSV